MQDRRPDLITITCLLGWLFIFADLLFFLIPNMHSYLSTFLPSFLLYAFIAMDIIFAIALWAIWKLRIIGIWLYTIALLVLLSMEYIYSIKIFSSAALGITFFIVFIYHYKDFKPEEE